MVTELVSIRTRCCRSSEETGISLARTWRKYGHCLTAGRIAVAVLKILLERASSAAVEDATLEWAPLSVATGLLCTLMSCGCPTVVRTLFKHGMYKSGQNPRDDLLLLTCALATSLSAEVVESLLDAGVGAMLNTSQSPQRGVGSASSPQADGLSASISASLLGIAVL